MLLISAAQKKGSEASRVLLNTDEAEAARASVGTAALADKLRGAGAGAGRASQGGVESYPGSGLTLLNSRCLVSGVLPGPGACCPRTSTVSCAASGPAAPAVSLCSSLAARVAAGWGRLAPLARVSSRLRSHGLEPRGHTQFALLPAAPSSANPAALRAHRRACCRGPGLLVGWGHGCCMQPASVRRPVLTTALWALSPALQPRLRLLRAGAFSLGGLAHRPCACSNGPVSTEHLLGWSLPSGATLWGFLRRPAAHVTPDPEVVLESFEWKLCEVCLGTKCDPEKAELCSPGPAFPGPQLGPCHSRLTSSPEAPRAGRGLLLWCLWQLNMSEVIRRPVCRKGETEAQRGQLPGIEPLAHGVGLRVGVLAPVMTSVAGHAFVPSPLSHR